MFFRFLASERGATSTEYALIVSLLVFVIVAGINNMRGEMDTMYDSIETEVTAATN